MYVMVQYELNKAIELAVNQAQLYNQKKVAYSNKMTTVESDNVTC